MRVAKFVESYFDAWNHCDPKGVADHLTDDGFYCDIPQNERRSHDELITSLSQFFAHNRQRYELIGDILSSKDTIAFQYKITPLEISHQSAHSHDYCGAEFMTLNGDAAMTITDYYDRPDSVRRSNIANIAPPKMAGHKYAKSGLSAEQLLEYKSRLEQIMQKQQIFLRPDLTLPKLAEAVNCSVNHLSQVINAGIGVSFFDYLNQYRIAYARQLLSGSDSRSSAVLNIAFTVGFNSNSAFYAAFKKCVGQTPAQYRRAQTKSTH